MHGEPRVSAQERTGAILSTLDRCGGLHSGELPGRTIEIMRHLRRTGEVNAMQLTIGRNGKRAYGHYSLFKPHVKPGSMVYFRDIDELFAHWFATNLLRRGLEHSGLISLGAALEKMGLNKEQREMVFIEVNSSYGKSKTHYGIRKGENGCAEILKLLDQSTVLLSSRMSRRQKALLKALYEQDKIKRVKIAERSGSKNPHLKGHYDLFRPGPLPGEYVYFRKFSPAVAKRMADFICQPVDQNMARALTHAFRRMGFEEDEARLMIAIAYPDYYKATRAAIELRKERQSQQSSPN